MALTLYEQETNINYNREEDEVTFYTANPHEWRRLERAGLRPDHTDYDQRGAVTGKTFIFPKSCMAVSIRLSPAQRRHVHLGVSSSSRTAARTNVRPLLGRGKSTGQGAKVQLNHEA